MYVACLQVGNTVLNFDLSFWVCCACEIELFVSDCAASNSGSAKSILWFSQKKFSSALDKANSSNQRDIAL